MSAQHSISFYDDTPFQTVAAIYAFFKAMTLYPEVQAKAQAEIDAVVGTDRLPTLLDRKDLPYVNAVANEVLRWHSVTPTGRRLYRVVSVILNPRYVQVSRIE